MRITYGDYKSIFEFIPGMEPVEFAKYLFELRFIKSRREAAVMRKCCGIAVDAFKAAVDQVVLGRTTEEDFYHNYAAASFDLGADDMVLQLVVEFGPVWSSPLSPPSSTRSTASSSLRTTISSRRTAART